MENLNQQSDGQNIQDNHDDQNQRDGRQDPVENSVDIRQILKDREIAPNEYILTDLLTNSIHNDIN